MSQLWTISKLADNSVLAVTFATAGADVHPKDVGWPWDATTQKATKISAQPDPATQVWSGTAWGEDAAKIEAMLLPQIKAEAERRRMLLYTPNRGKMKIYERQDREVQSWYALGALGAAVNTLLVAFNLLTTVQKSRMFRAAMTNAARMGDTVDKAIARFEAGIAASDQAVLNIEATEQASVKAVKAAATGAAKRAAFAAINWNWSA